MNPTVFLVLTVPAPMTALEPALSECGRYVAVSSGAWVLVSYHPLEEVLARIGPQTGEGIGLLVVPVHEYGAHRLEPAVKALIDAAWHR